MTLNYDGSLDLATGGARTAKQWKNRVWLWSELLIKISKTHRTPETLSEYLALPKGKQDDIKDIGGFVGGYLINGSRKNGSCMHRQLLTLDLDSGGPGVLDDFIDLYGNAACIYTTHKHQPKYPRTRLLIPLDRPVTPDEYQAIARKIAGTLDIQRFDPTTFQPLRLMYWPSTSSDGEYKFSHVDAEWLKADKILSSFVDWRDTSSWPQHDKEHKQINAAIKKQADPLAKTGLLGAFCRAHTIAEAIALYLPDVYVPTDAPDRYTYINGTTAAGLVIYEDKFCYSHHGTDPLSGKLCNAFDLVRLHKFGHLDEGVDENKPVNRLRSWSEMLELAGQDRKVREQLGADKMAGAKEAFAEQLINDALVSDDNTAEVDEGWIAKLDIDKKGNYLSTIDNIVLILEHDPLLRGRFRLNEFSHHETIWGKLPWRKGKSIEVEFKDSDEANLRHYLESVYNLSNTAKTRDALTVVLGRHTYHPVRDYLTGLRWDKVNRLDSLIIDYLGAEDSEYVRAVTRKAFVACVARVMQPGCKFDHVLTLVGNEGLGKSTLLYNMGQPWFSDSLHTVQGKEAYEQLQGAWILELGELAGLKKAEVEQAKHFISKREDRFRVAYGRRVENFARQCVFFGTTNDDQFLKDSNGNRRFWVVDVSRADATKDVFTMDQFVIDQLWAEALGYYYDCEELYLTGDLEEVSHAEQMKHTDLDERVGQLVEYLNMPVPEQWEEMSIYERRGFLQGEELTAKGTVYRKVVCIAEIWCEVLGGTVKDMTPFNTKPVKQLLTQVPGWRRASGVRRFKQYGVHRYYEKKL